MKNIIWLTALLGMHCANHIDPAALRLADRHDIDITQNEKLGTPATVQGNLADLSKIKTEKRLAPLLQFIKENPQLFKLNEPDTELHLLRSDRDDLGFIHYRFERVHKGVPIYGDELLFHVNAKSQLYQVNGTYHPSITADVEPAIPAQKAGELALEQGVTHKMQKVDSATLSYYPFQEELHLTWYVILSGGMNKWDYFIDAQNGTIIFNQDRRRF
jgi:Zn-dependent metalloprotease